jgi:AraC family transcriptional regulator of adaptative response/methylated-DNA-[protein]-cysteine methyltransferase
MKPSQFQNGGRGTRIRFATAESTLGWVLVAATERGVCAIDLGDDPARLEERLRERFPQAEFEDDPGFRQWLDQVVAFVASPNEGFNLLLDIQGTAFQRRVWETLQHIPAGSTASYSEIAGQIGRPKAARAVAQACASNKIAVAIPCHRVVRGDGALGGYRWGIERKRLLLKRERQERESEPRF